MNVKFEVGKKLSMCTDRSVTPSHGFLFVHVCTFSVITSPMSGFESSLCALLFPSADVEPNSTSYSSL